MCTSKSDSMIKETLKSICCSDGLWCYGILWAIDQRNSLLLTLKDAYYGEEMGTLMDNVLLQVHVLGEGTIGKVAFTNSNKWMYSDSSHGTQNALGSFETLQILQDNSEFYCQFSMGIKTIALISVEELGVVQLGSTQKITQTSELAEQVNGLFRGIGESQNNEMLENGSFSDHFLNSSSQLMPVLSSEISSLVNQNFQHYPVVSSQPFPSTMDHPNTNTLFTPSFLIDDHIQVGDHIDFQASDYINDSDSSIMTSFWPYLLSLDELLNENKRGVANDYPQWFTPQPGISSNSVSNLLCTDLPHAPENVPSNSVQSSVTYAFGSNREERSKVRPYNSLFSQLGLDQISKNSSCSKVRFEDQVLSAAKRRKIDINYSYNCDQEKIQGLAKIAEEIRSSNAVFDSDSEANLTQMRRVQLAKMKKGRTGVKKRPKDRQMIQDRLAELRELIPNGDKMSIDRLLERTIKHLNFMQGVKTHAEILKKVDNQKCEAKEKDIPSNGVTWACEVDNQNMICPLIVQDLNTPGQMLIEILCEEHSFLLEIADIVRGFGLVILKGVMKVREGKIWARYIVEAEDNQHVTRHKVFTSLIQLLQITGQSSVDADDSYSNVMYPSLFNNRQPDALFPVSLVDTLN